MVRDRGRNHARGHDYATACRVFDFGVSSERGVCLVLETRPTLICSDRSFSLCVTSVATSHLTPSTIKDDVSHELRQIWCGLGIILDYCSGPVERVIQLVYVDFFDENQPVVCAKILDRKVHELPDR